MDRVSPQVRSRIMARVGSRDTKPEIAVRRLLSRLGVRYRVRNKDLPGNPDIANRARGWAIFVNGCFWHGHRNCPRLGTRSHLPIPQANASYWKPKIIQNRSRDARCVTQLRRKGFRVLLIWDCELRDPTRLQHRIATLLGR
jgi:DNA mismatch endonuclease, patch repair protein